ncbi:hypothetical protein FF011L_44460 [Roseimaritima multifibrata]|uniref:Uncharacterized protein n=1 Tax=Roseimaritima multifibrata TaxID=1930274 RepID=A0A517ML83_9BACT|nr:hypothetical protein [Roseimaritima multifibrata]QDS95648.1 hypothetical protein FF011L_44460 [Roseimaritima multifibrata]
MKRLKAPLIATAIVLVVTVVFGIGSIALIYNSSGSNRNKAERAGMVGGGIAAFGCIVIAPFWLYAAAKIGQERRRNRT